MTDVVRTTDYKLHSQRDRDGVVAEFQLTPSGRRVVRGKRTNWCVVQNIDLRLEYTHRGGQRTADSWSFSELFLKKNARTKLRDYFTVSRGDRTATTGFLHVVAVAWVARDRPKGFKISSAGKQPWGTQPGSPDQLRAPPGALRRTCRIEWDNRRRAVGTKGSDLSITYS